MPKPEQEPVSKSLHFHNRGVVSFFQNPYDRKYIIRLGLTLFLISIISAALLGIVHHTANPIIEARTREKTVAAMQSVLAADYYRDWLFYEPQNGVTAVSEAIVSGSPVGYVCEVSSNGFGGAMNLVIGIDLQGTVTGVSVIKHSETENIGTKVVENETVLSDLIGLTAPITLSGGEDGFDAVSGATYSSTGVVDAVNAAVHVVQEGGE